VLVVVVVALDFFASSFDLPILVGMLSGASSGVGVACGFSSETAMAEVANREHAILSKFSIT